MFNGIFNFSRDDFRLISKYNPLKFFPDFKFSEKVEFKSMDINDELLDSSNNLDLVFTYYKDISKESHRNLILNSKYRFDLFVLKPKVIGRELSKTLSLKYESLDRSKSSILQILSGYGYALLEDLKDEKNLKLVKVEKGSYVYVPKGFVFVLINKSLEENLVCLSLNLRVSELILGTLKSVSGATLYYTTLGFVKNKNALAFYSIDEHFGEYVDEFSFDKKKGLYVDFLDLPEKFGFLK